MVIGNADEYRRTAVQAMEQHIIYRIVSGEYMIGQRLPSIRALAEKLGVNRGIVEKAVRRLIEERILRSEAGRGVFVVRVPRADLSAWRDRITASVRRILLEAKLSGFSRPEMVDLVHSQIARIFAPLEEKSFAFFECNRWDAEAIAQLLKRELQAPFVPAVLSEVDGRTSKWKRCRLFVTCLDHLAELQELFPGRRTIGVQYTPTTDSLLEIARLRRDVRLGVVCHYPRTIDLFVRTIETVRPVAATCVANDLAQLRALFKKVDVVIVSRFARDRVRAVRPRIPTITMELHLTDQSVNFLKGELATCIQEEASARRA